MTAPVLLREFEDFAANGGGGGPSWLLPLRRAAIDRFASLGFPTPKNEDWHFTSVSPIAEGSFRTVPPARFVRLEAADVEPFTFGRSDWIRLVFVNGRFDGALSSGVERPRGVTVTDLATAWREQPELLERHVGTVADFQRTAFTALNTAFMHDGAVVRIAPNVELETPVHVVFVSTPDAAGSASHVRTLIVAGHHAKATVIESYVSLGGAKGYFTNAVTEAVLGDGATLAHVKLQTESERAFHVGTLQAHQARDSHLVSFSFAAGGELARTNIYTLLAGEGSGATLHGLYLLDGEQHVDQQTRIEHASPNTFSREVYKGILDGASHGVFNGQVYVRPEAQKTDGKQENNNLLLSAQARVDTKPQLEIFADDVKCTHGATVGRLDELALFYMKSRGIGAEQARKLLTYAFAAGVIEAVGVPEVRAELEALTLRRFTGAAAGS
ncbi:MAG TPA: Fe-S cluster assembly protein SufD [Gemmatimonadaceae bacterium]|nr:Fe-S cluster assembly protein SufD [Gemmatimonadaceae bacterium]